jgi:hypothetical protein
MATPPLAHRTTRVTISGTCFGGAEEWSTGFWIGNETADADLPTQGLVDDIRTAWQTFFVTSSSYVANTFTSTLVKASSVGTDGKASAEDTMYATFTGNAAGARTENFPPQIALVATLVSTKARGVGAKGRMYLPGIVAPVDATGHINGTTQAGILTNFKTFLTAVNASTATTNVIMLASHGSLTAAGTPRVGGSAPINKAVVSVRLGNVYDTQRRRRNGLAEAYGSQTI